MDSEMTLSNFEHFVEAVIIQQGLAYYENGRVASLEESERGYFSAFVNRRVFCGSHRGRQRGNRRLRL